MYYRFFICLVCFLVLSRDVCLSSKRDDIQDQTHKVFSKHWRFKLVQEANDKQIPRGHQYDFDTKELLPENVMKRFGSDEPRIFAAFADASGNRSYKSCPKKKILDGLVFLKAGRFFLEKPPFALWCVDNNKVTPILSGYVSLEGVLTNNDLEKAISIGGEQLSKDNDFLENIFKENIKNLTIVLLEEKANVDSLLKNEFWRDTKEESVKKNVVKYEDCFLILGWLKSFCEEPKTPCNTKNKRTKGTDARVAKKRRISEQTVPENTSPDQQVNSNKESPNSASPVSFETNSPSMSYEQFLEQQKGVKKLGRAWASVGSDQKHLFP